MENFAPSAALPHYEHDQTLQSSWRTIGTWRRHAWFCPSGSIHKTGST